MQPRRTLGFTSLVALTFFCVAGGAYGLEDAIGEGGPFVALLCLASMAVANTPTKLVSLAGIVLSLLVYGATTIRQRHPA